MQSSPYKWKGWNGNLLFCFWVAFLLHTTMKIFPSSLIVPNPIFGRLAFNFFDISRSYPIHSKSEIKNNNLSNRSSDLDIVKCKKYYFFQNIWWSHTPHNPKQNARCFFSLQNATNEQKSVICFFFLKRQWVRIFRREMHMIYLIHDKIWVQNRGY